MKKVQQSWTLHSHWCRYLPILDPRNELGTAELGFQNVSNVFDNQDTLLKKIELPIFDGSVPRVERYFRAA